MVVVYVPMYGYLMSLLKKSIYLNGLQFVDTCNGSMDGCMDFRIIDLSDMHYGSVRCVQDTGLKRVLKTNSPD